MTAGVGLSIAGKCSNGSCDEVLQRRHGRHHNKRLEHLFSACTITPILILILLQAPLLRC
jgi:hypothetical protein